MYENLTLQNVFGTTGTILWSGQIIPQIWKNWRRKSTFGLSPYLMLIWSLSSIFLGVYTIVQNINVPLIVQPQAFGLLAAFCWVQCMYYGSKKSLPLCVVIFCTYVLLATAFQVGFVFAFKHLLAVHASGAEQGLQVFGIMSACLISIGLIPQFLEIYQLKEVQGISLLFMAVDIAGGIFSLLSLAFKKKWDITASVIYILVIVLDGLIVLLALILNAPSRARRRQRRHSVSETTHPSLEEQEDLLRIPKRWVSESG